MKHKILLYFSLTTIFLTVFITASAQEADTSFSVGGVVKDQKSKKKLEYVNVSVEGTNIATVTNADGEFTLKVPERYHSKKILFSHLGYKNLSYSITKNNVIDETFFLTPDNQTLSEVVVRSGDPLTIVTEAIHKVDHNYSDKNQLLTGFYRETVQKGRRYIDISEAILDIYKTPYSESANNEQVRIFKGRRLLSPKASDTLSVKLQGGPNLAIYGDVMKNSDGLLAQESLAYYNFKMEGSILIDNNLHYIISFTPKMILPFPLYSGELYINQQSLTVSRIEYRMNMDDRTKVTNIILKKKPAKLRFRPEEMSFIVTYKQQDGRSQINYIRNTIRFKCDWKRRLFSTNYTVISEVVITNSKTNDISRISGKETFKQNQILSEKISAFTDNNYWKDYNIIEPTESLESAVAKLRKQYK